MKYKEMGKEKCSLKRNKKRKRKHRYDRVVSYDIV